VVATWLGAAVAVLFVVATTTVGPVVLRLSDRHGVHAGDVVGAVVIVAGAALVTACLLWPQVVSPRVLVVGAVWLLAAVGVVAVATQTAVGPIVLPLGHHRDVRAGDLLAAWALFGTAVLVTVGVALRPRRSCGPGAIPMKRGPHPGGMA
jgi:hypothetical protein